MPRLLIALPSADFDPTETAVPWRTAIDAGLDVVFATEDGEPGTCDPLVLKGPLLGLLGATATNCKIYAEMAENPAFQRPVRFADVDVDTFDGLLLPGGHAKGMRPYLESVALQDIVRGFFARDRPVGAICHGPVVLARTLDGRTGASVVAGRRLTALTRPLENIAWLLTFWLLGDYYRTYPQWVQSELVDAVGEAGKFELGPVFASYARPFTVRDGNLLTARWPGDSSLFARELVAMLGGDDR